MTDGMWVGKDVHRGVPSEDVADRPKSPRWRLEDVWAIARPYNPTVSPNGSTVAFFLDFEGTTDLWTARCRRGYLSSDHRSGTHRLLGRRDARLVPGR